MSRVGAYLSGGVDSSLIVSLMTELSGGSGVETFSARLRRSALQHELPYAREVSNALSTRHHEVIVRPRDFQDLWHKLTWHRDAPISEPADLAIFRLASTARESVKVLLSGEGSDELFAGYPKYAYANKAALADFLPPSLRQPLFTGIERTLPVGAAKLRIMLRAMSARSEADRMQTWFAPFTRDERDRMIAGRERDGYREIWSRARGDLIQRMLYVDCHTWLVDNLLERGDRMAMAASVESRPSLPGSSPRGARVRPPFLAQGQRRHHKMGRQGGRASHPAGAHRRSQEGGFSGSAGSLVPKRPARDGTRSAAGFRFLRLFAHVATTDPASPGRP